jgi:hypothetical protein
MYKYGHQKRNQRKTRKGGMTGIEIGIAVVAGIAGAAYLYRPSAQPETYDALLLSCKFAV